MATPPGSAPALSGTTPNYAENSFRERKELRNLLFGFDFGQISVGFGENAKFKIESKTDYDFKFLKVFLDLEDSRNGDRIDLGWVGGLLVRREQ